MLVGVGVDSLIPARILHHKKAKLPKHLQQSVKLTPDVSIVKL